MRKVLAAEEKLTGGSNTAGGRSRNHVALDAFYGNCGSQNGGEYRGTRVPARPFRPPALGARLNLFTRRVKRLLCKIAREFKKDRFATLGQLSSQEAAPVAPSSDLDVSLRSTTRNSDRPVPDDISRHLPSAGGRPARLQRREPRAVINHSARPRRVWRANSSVHVFFLAEMIFSGKIERSRGGLTRRDPLKRGIVCSGKRGGTRGRGGATPELRRLLFARARLKY
ncbi:hypothetical protein EVAR_51969_1 [Eumeta japonica]|uniref:Uncharacterized protein n=1 Tax=Eumeta variegata TaxID=151549 RepID=A0A4C1Y1M8_EUMVA|nr:hypothetical protein EVAR_51969_1 [Eumeta japonica]